MSIECDAVRLAESRGGRILRCTEFFYPVGTTPESETFCNFLQDCMQAFCPKARHRPLWVSDGLPGLQARYLVLPWARSGSVSDMVYWAFRKDLPFSPAHTLFDYHVEMRTKTERGNKLHAIAYTVPRQEAGALTDLLKSAQLQATGIIVPPFAMRNLLQHDDSIGDGVRLLVFVGADATTLLIVLDGKIQSCRIFKTGMHSLLDLVAVHFPGYTPMEAFQYIGAALTTQEPGALERQIREVIERIIQQIELSLAVYTNEHPGQTIEGLHVLGAIAGIAPFSERLEERLGVDAHHLALPDVHFSSQGAAIESLPQTTVPDRMALAAGAALSSQDSMPNLLCTRQERDHLVKHTQCSTLAAILFAVIVLLLHLAYRICDHHNQQLRLRLDAETAQLEAFSPRVDQTLVADMLQKLENDRSMQKRIAAHWLPFAIFRPVLEQALPDMYLTDIAYTAAVTEDTSRGTGSPASNSRTKPALLQLRGVIAGDPTLQRAKLASFTMHLEDTPLLETVRTMHIQERTEDAGDELSFTIEAELVSCAPMNPASGDGRQP